MSAVRWLLLLATALLLAPGAAAAQAIQVTGGEDDPAVQRLREVLARGSYLLLAHDTVLPASFHAPGDLLVMGSDVRLEGTVEGDAVVVGGRLFLRPGSRVGGAAVGVDAGLYPSARATVGTVLESSVSASVEVEGEGEAYALRYTEYAPDPRFRLPGLFGLAIPTYDRVNGLSVGWGSAWTPLGEAGIRVGGAVRWHTARAAPGGEVFVSFPLRPDLALLARAARETRTNELWIRGDLVNSLAALTTGNDPRNYYESDVVELALTRVLVDPPIAGELAVVPRLTASVSRDRSLRVRNPWSLFGELDRENPPVEPGVLASVSGGAGVQWKGRTTALTGDASVEQALPAVGDFEFTRWELSGAWQMQALYGHRITVSGIGRGTLAGSSPPQRWSIVGGGETLPTLDTGARRGEQLAFVRSRYTVPVPRLQLPLVGPPSLALAHAVGSAWGPDESPGPWVQNVGVGAELRFLSVTVWVDPSGPLEPTLTTSLALPF